MEIRANKQVILDGKTINSWEEVESAYRKRMETFGPGHKALHYSSESVHNATLAYASKILHSIVKANNSVLDVGCGIGALVPFMPPCVYRGIDLVRESVVKARSLYPDLKFDCTNLTEVTKKYDWIIMIGITGSVPMPEALIKRAWKLAIRGIIIDFVDFRKDRKDDLNTYNMGACTEFFLNMGAQQINLYPTARNTWNVFVVHKQSLWL